MSKPWMPLYISDYRNKTADLTAAEHGAYLLLIMHYWVNGGLPSDQGKLMRIAAMTPAEWKKSRATLQFFFHDGWKHERVDGELAKAEQISSKRRAAAEQRYCKEPANAPANAEQAESKSRHTRDVVVSSLPTSATSLEVKEVEAEQASGEFEEFWNIYPHKVGKKDAERSFEKAIKTVDFTRIMAGLLAYAAKTDDRPWCNPATWLNQGRWDDQPAQINPQNRNGNHVQTTRDIGKAELKQALGELGDYIEASRADGGTGEEVVRPLPAAGRG